MKKAMIIGSLFVIILFLLMPSTSAIQLNAVENAVYNDFLSQNKNIDFKELKDIENIEELPDHPILYYFVLLVFYSRYFRFAVYLSLSLDITWEGNIPDITTKHPLLLLWGGLFFFRAEMWDDLWYFIANKMGWNWKPM